MRGCHGSLLQGPHGGRTGRKQTKLGGAPEGDRLPWGSRGWAQPGTGRTRKPTSPAPREGDPDPRTSTLPNGDPHASPDLSLLLVGCSQGLGDLPGPGGTSLVPEHRGRDVGQQAQALHRQQGTARPAGVPEHSVPSVPQARRPRRGRTASPLRKPREATESAPQKGLGQGAGPSISGQLSWSRGHRALGFLHLRAGVGVGAARNLEGPE